jgi:Cys-tRNA(Pro) deacylase
MKEQNSSGATPATQFLKQREASFVLCPYPYQDQGGTAASSKALGVDEHVVIKTLIMQDELARPLIVLMHGDKKVSTKALARNAKVKSIEPCKIEVAQRHTGYLVGGTSPFATKKLMPIYVEESILSLPEIYINGGQRGLLVRIDPSLLTQLLQAIPVQCAID